MNKEVELRKIALETLIQIEKNNAPSHLVIKDVLDKYDYLSKTEKALFSTIVKGTIERRIELDYVCDLYSKTPHNKMKLPIRTIIEMGIYQILYMNSYDTLAVNSSVELARKKGFSTLAGFVNAVLRNISKNKDNIKYPEKGDENYLSVKYSMPLNLVKLLVSQYDEDTVEKMLKASLESDFVRIRISEKVSASEKEEIIEDFKKKGAEIIPVNGFDNLFNIKGMGNIGEFKSFMSGKIYIQDVGSYMLVKNVPYGERILDTCSAPGGKSIFLSERYPDAKITACDISEDKISRIKENIERCKASNIDVQICDATVFNPEFEEAFDVVVADVPCSGLGVIGKKQDIKYRLTDESLESLYGLQKNIIDNVSKYVKKGGYLCYSTCTVNKKENEEQIGRFLSENDFEFSEFSFVPENMKDKVNKGCLSLMQGIDDSDGFFISVLTRKN
ncbi:MAG: 16S rRNA (cytosine(967)-C(5))-methyltransferase RsmB [Lachnospiraceae bacterium]|nr:16S rRNA (cytosine(967)-C(5))-methyltransferase RsmB [Lachnospiraceae bacterium]